jgi:hypothetical protein
MPGSQRICLLPKGSAPPLAALRVPLQDLLLSKRMDDASPSVCLVVEGLDALDRGQQISADSAFIYTSVCACCDRYWYQLNRIVLTQN